MKTFLPQMEQLYEQGSSALYEIFSQIITQVTPALNYLSYGSAAPEGKIAGLPGSLYIQTDANENVTWWIKGATKNPGVSTASNTNWRQVFTVPAPRASNPLNVGASVMGGPGASITLGEAANGVEQTLVPPAQIQAAAGLGNVADGPVFKKVTGVSGANQITTPSVQANAVSAFSTYDLVTDVPLTYATWVEIGSVSLTPDDGFVLVFIDGEYDNQSANNLSVNTKMQKNGVDSGAQIITQVPFQTAGEFNSFSFVRPDVTPGTAANIYSIWAYLQLNVSQTVQCNGLNLIALNLKA